MLLKRIRAPSMDLMPKIKQLPTAFWEQVEEMVRAMDADGTR